MSTQQNDLLEHFRSIRVCDPRNEDEERYVIDNIGRAWIEDHFDDLVALLERGASNPVDAVTDEQTKESGEEYELALINRLRNEGASGRHTTDNAHVCCEHDASKNCCDNHPGRSVEQTKELTLAEIEGMSD